MAEEPTPNIQQRIVLLAQMNLINPRQKDKHPRKTVGRKCSS
jgi:hypothetical protein